MAKESELEGMTNGINAIIKRNGAPAAFDEEKIAKGIFKAAKTVGGDDYSIAQEVAKKVHGSLSTFKQNGVYVHSGKKIPHVQDIQEAIIKVLRNEGYDGTAASYELYMKKREKVRKKLLQVSGERGLGDSTDQSLLLVDALSKDKRTAWDRSRIEIALVSETDVPFDVAKEIAKEVETVALLGDYTTMSTDLIKELVNAGLAKRGYKEQLEGQAIIGMSVYDLEKLLFSKSNENSNVATNNPEAVNLAIAENTLKKYALQRVFSKKAADAHMQGKIHLHDLGMPIRVYCSSHSVEYIKKYGLELENLQASSLPAKHSHTLTGHLNTFIASMQAYYAGALGIAYVNIMYAPLLEQDLQSKASIVKALSSLRSEVQTLSEQNPVLKLEDLINKIDDTLNNQGSYEELKRKFLKQEAQYMIFSGAQNAFSRGGQTVFLDFNIHAGVPEYLKKVPAIGPGGKYMFRSRDGEIKNLKEVTKEQDGLMLKDLVLEEDGRTVFTESLKEIPLAGGKKQRTVEQNQINLSEGEKVLTYGDYEQTAQDFAVAMMDVWGDGERDGLPFSFPKCDFHVDEKSFSVESHKKVFDKACDIAAKNGSTYFIFDRDAATLSACCRLKTVIEDDYMIKHPESMRFCGFQNVTINIPQASYRAGADNLEGLTKELDEMMELVAQSHVEKKEFIKKLQIKGGPQWQTGKSAPDGRPYVDLDKSTYIIGLIGLNDAIQHQIGKELHELTAEECKKIPLKLVAHMNKTAKELSEKYGMKFSLEESPAESTTRRFAKIDVMKYPNDAPRVVKGSIEGDSVYYTNSIHLRADAPVDITTRIQYQSMFHTAIDSGAITHAFVGDKIPSKESIANLVKKTYENTQTAQLTISPEFTSCKKCGHLTFGVKAECPMCHSDELTRVSRIVGYFSEIDLWNKSKKDGELPDRQKAKLNYRPENELDNPLNNYVRAAVNGKKEAHIFGKEGCEKCKSLISRTEKFIKKENIGDKVELIYHNLLDEDEFAEGMWHGINPSRIPTLVIQDKTGVLAKLETDYSDPKKSMIKPDSYEHILRGEPVQ
jgi:anaerobic ribonucleoside-triphosphate reductase